MSEAWLIRRATLRTGEVVDVRVERGRVAAIAADLPATSAATIDADLGLLIPGLHDHHIHLAATAALWRSTRVGPPDIVDAPALAEILAAPGSGWLRGVGYHESVAGHIDRHWLDEAAPHRPVRIQHRSGRLWILNSLGLESILALGLAPPAGLERVGGDYTGRLYDEDVWLRRALAGAPPPLDSVGAALAKFGVTGVTDMSPANDDAAAAYISAERDRGALPQRVVIAGALSLSEALGLARGAAKLHLLESALPDYDETVSFIRAAHLQERPVAAHCVTEVELTFTLAALREAGVRAGDRIEHASVTSEGLLQQIAGLGVAVVAQPNFVSERGDSYRAAIAPAEWPSLYRLRAFLAAGVPLAAGSDAPFGAPDPWAAMAAAVTRRTSAGEILGAEEALTPEEALDLFLADPSDLSQHRALRVGAPADLCLLSQPWAKARNCLHSDLVRATFVDGRSIHQRVDKPPL
ncbi:MAG: amidohydrolase family protein [Hyphomonadaceae bacterium]|nr:amidohydrolase family protein [Hyphomonadaceae bacterium]